MLSRTADNLFWIARYMERAENIARMLRVTDRLSLMPSSTEGEGTEWQSTLIVSGTEDIYYDKYDEVTPENVIFFLAFDRDNPSSIRNCIELARRNARAVRTAMTTEQWEALNGAWLELPSWDETRLRGSGLHRFLDWVKERSLLFYGTTIATMLRRDSYYFTRLGTFIERGDNTARILDVKYHLLLPDNVRVGGGIDFYQWAAILRAVSGYRSYHALYKEGIKPWLIAEFVILHDQMPRSLVSCSSAINDCLENLTVEYGEKNDAYRIAGQIHSQLRYGKVEDIFNQGLHEFLSSYIERNHKLGQEISRSYLLG
ncbi:MAG: hypothetical protein GC184_04020 [Rhizobiales bacterium]|nr:hypothetical protein [Hyphomicrobiales bacterium]